MLLLFFEVKEAKITETKINEARENYRPAAERASLLYFILNDLNKINPIYQFSLKVGGTWAPGQGLVSTGPVEQIRPIQAAHGDGGYLGHQIHPMPAPPAHSSRHPSQNTPEAPEPARRASVALTDRLPRRSMWCLRKRSRRPPLQMRSSSV